MTPSSHCAVLAAERERACNTAALAAEIEKPACNLAALAAEIEKPACNLAALAAEIRYAWAVRQQPQTYALTVVCSERMRLFQRTANAELLIATLFRYRDYGRFLLHAFVVMPDHVHLVCSPTASLEQTVGLIKGGFSFAVRKQYTGTVWQDGHYAHRVIDQQDYLGQIKYIAHNPRRKGWIDYPFVHARHTECVDPMPSHLGG